MRFLFYLIMLILFGALLVVGLFFFLARALFQLNAEPGSKAWKSLVANLRDRVAQQAQSLIPWENETLALLSLNRLNEVQPGFFNTIRSGIYATIYQEPALVFAEQRSGKTSVLLAKTSNREYVYRNKGRETDIWLNGQPFGVLVDGALLAPGKGSRLLARMDAPSDENVFPILIGDKTAGVIANPAKNSGGPNPRALTLLKEMTPQEEDVVLALSILKIVGQ